MDLQAELEDGTPVLFRPIRPDDKELLRRGFEQLSPESRYMRFFSVIDELSDEQLRYLTEVDGDNHFAWVAVHADNPEVGFGVSRWIRTKEDPQIAEGAVTVIDRWHGQGLGTTLLYLAASSAIDKGLRAFKVTVLGSNNQILNLLREADITAQGWESGVAEIEVPLPTSPEELRTGPGLLILKAVAAGDLKGHAKEEGVVAELRVEERP